MLPTKPGSMSFKPQVAAVLNDDPVQKLTSLQARIDEIEKKKIQSQKEMELFQKAYDEKVEELKEYGITDVNDLQGIITQMETELKEQIEALDKSLTSVESQIQ